MMTLIVPPGAFELLSTAAVLHYVVVTIFELLLLLLFSLTTGLSCVTILATALCIVGWNVYDADFVLAKILLISFAYALIVNNNNNNDK